MILVSSPKLDGNEKKYLNECIDTNWISAEGRFVRQLEAQMASFLGIESAVAVSSGTAALQVALYALNLPKGSEIIIPANTIISCAIAPLALGLVPVIVDVDEEGNICPQEISKAVSEKTSAIMVVHFLGHPCQMGKILQIAKQKNLKIIEDCAQAIGSTYKGAKLGSLGDIGACSFFANKTITTGEGGMVFCKTKEHRERANSYKSLCFGKENKFIHEDLGYNFKMSNLQAAVGVAQMERVEEIIQFKKNLGEKYLLDLKNSGLGLPTQSTDSTYWMFGVTSQRAKEIQDKLLNEYKIQTRPFFVGLHRQEVLRGLVKVFDCPKSDYLSQRGFYLPSGLGLKEEEYQRVVFALKSILGGF